MITRLHSSRMQYRPCVDLISQHALYPGGAWSGGGIPACTEADPPPVNRMTNRCKNITLPQTSFAGGNNDSISDLETSVAETEDLISVLDDDVTEMDVLVSTLQEENAQLQQTVNLLLQRVAALEATDTFTNNTLDGIIIVVGMFCAVLNVLLSCHLSEFNRQISQFNSKKIMKYGTDFSF